MGNLINLKELYLSDNRFSKDIPPSFGKLVNLEVLLLANNSLTGVIPAEMREARKLQFMQVLDNEGLKGQFKPRCSMKIDTTNTAIELEDCFH